MSNFKSFQRFRYKQLLRRQQALGKALLVGVAQERAQSMQVGLDAIRPEILAHQVARVFRVANEPGQHEFQRRRFVQVLIDFALREDESFIKRLRDPGMLFVQFTADDDGVHDREDFCALVIFALHRFVILEQEADALRALRNAGRSSRRVNGVDFSVAKHLGKGVVLGNIFQANFRRQGNGLFFGSTRRFFAATEIRDAGNRDMVFVAQNAANPYAGGQLIFRIADALSDQVLRLADAAVAIDEDAGVPERPGRKNRDGDKGPRIAKQGKRVGGERHFGDVKFLVADHPKKSFLYRDVDVGQVDPVDGNALFEQGARAVIIPAGQR